MTWKNLRNTQPREAEHERFYLHKVLEGAKQTKSEKIQTVVAFRWKEDKINFLGD